MSIIKYSGSLNSGVFYCDAIRCVCRCHLVLFPSPCGNWGLGTGEFWACLCFLVYVSVALHLPLLPETFPSFLSTFYQVYGICHEKLTKNKKVMSAQHLSQGLVSCCYCSCNWSYNCWFQNYNLWKFFATLPLPSTPHHLGTPYLSS